MAAPFEVIAAPYTVYVAPTGTAKPLVNVAPAAAWIQLGTSGTKNYSTKGVVVTHNQTIVTWKPAGSTGARKAWRQEEFITVEMELVDLSSAQYAQVMNSSAVSSIASPPSQKFNLQQGAVINEVAVLVRGISPVSEALNAQYFIPLAFQAESPAPAYAGEGVPAMLALKWQSLEDPAAGFGTWEDATS